ncbi:unnamed protein product, partial [Rotaria sp. Silwood2]
MLQHLFFLLAQCARSFAGPTNYVTATNSIPVSVAEADLDGVNGLDIVVANSGTDNVGVLLNNANVDGVPGFDIVVANSGTDNVGVLSGNGAGRFAAQQTFSTGVGSKPMSVFVADVTGAGGNLDIVVANSGTDNVGILMGNGAGGFVLQTPISTGGGSKPMSVFVTNVNGGGGNLDIVVANSGTDNVGVIIANAMGGGFLPQVPYSTGVGSKPMSVYVTDLNAATNPDIVVANSGTDNVGVLLNTGVITGIFLPQVVYATGAGSKPMSVFVADLDGANNPDIVVANSGTDNVGVLLSNGAGTFAAQQTFSTGAGSKPMSVYVDNVGGTLRVDIAVANSGTNNVGVLLNNGAGVFAAQVTYATGLTPMSVATADLDGDTDLDIVVANRGTNNVGVFKNNGDGTFTAEVTYTTGDSSAPMSVFLANVDGVNGPDIIVANSGTNNVGVLLNNGGGTFATQVTYATGAGS